MAVAHDATSNVSPAFTNSASWTHTPVGTPTLALLWIQFDSSTVTVSGTPTYGGENMTLVAGPITQGTDRLYLYKKESPLSGARTVAYSLSTNVQRRGAAQTFTGTKLSDTLGTPATEGIADGNPSETVSSASGRLVADGIGWRQGSGFVRTAAVGAGQTERYNSGSGSGGLACSTEPGAASVTMSWTMDFGSSNTTQIVVDILAAPEFRDAATTIALTSTLAVVAATLTFRNAALTIALQSTMTAIAGVATVVNAAVSFAMTSTMAVAAGVATFVNAAVSIALSTTMSVAAEILEYVHATVSIALETTMNFAARIRAYLISPSKILRVVGLRHDPKTDRVTLDTEEV